MVYRLVMDYDGILEGSCIKEEQFKNVLFRDKCLFEPVHDIEAATMIEYKDEEYCADNCIEKMLFYTTREFDEFLRKKFENGDTY